MSPFTQRVKAAVDRHKPSTLLYECRHCGTTVDHESDQCPVCDSTEIASYPV